MNDLKIAGITVLYEPENYVIKNINSYIGQIEKLFILDNSENIDVKVYNFLNQNKKIEYNINTGNLGIAKAINIGAVKALDNNFDFLLTMDQDTFVNPDLIEKYMEFLSSNDFSNIGILAPRPSYLIGGKNKNVLSAKEVETAITSGSLLNLRIFKQAGSFLDDLFIDYIDYEYCLRLRKNNFKIIQLNSAKIHHQLGNFEKRHFFLSDIYVTHHPPIRYYYRTRNRLYVASRYFTFFPVFVLKDFFLFINEMVKVLLYEKNKVDKLKMVNYGVIDFLRNRYGKFESLHK